MRGATTIQERLWELRKDKGLNLEELSKLTGISKSALVDTVPHEIIERYRPDEYDPYLKVLQSAHVDDDKYFSCMVIDDINLIIRDVHTLHKKDSESAPQATVAHWPV